jgi:hypothetical protein
MLGAFGSNRQQRRWPVCIAVAAVVVLLTIATTTVAAVRYKDAYAEAVADPDDYTLPDVITHKRYVRCKVRPGIMRNGTAANNGKITSISIELWQNLAPRAVTRFLELVYDGFFGG